jgi:hypothetical protein
MDKIEASKKIIEFIKDKKISGKVAAAIFGIEKTAYYQKIAMIKAKYGSRLFSEIHYFLLLRAYKIHAEKQLDTIINFCRTEFRQSIRKRLNCRYFFVRFIKLTGIRMKDAATIIAANSASIRNKEMKISSEQMKMLIAHYKDKYEAEIAEIKKILL